MPLIDYGGSLLEVGGSLAGDEDCCCGPIYDTCQDCLDAVTAINATATGFIDSDNLCSGITGECTPSWMNDSFHLTRVTPEIGPVFEIVFGTLDDETDPGKLHNTRNSGGNALACYVYKMRGTLSCVGDGVRCVFAIFTHSMVNGTFVPASAGCTTCNETGTGEMGGLPVCYLEPWQDPCNNGELLVNDPSLLNIICEDPWTTYATDVTVSLEH